MIKTYIFKIQSRNLIHDQRLLAVPKISFQMIPKNKDHLVKNDTGSGSIFFSLNRDRDFLQKYWAIIPFQNVDRPFNSIDITYLPSKFNHVSGNTVHMINEKLPGKVVRQ